MTIGIQRNNNKHNKHCEAYYPAGKGLFNVSKIRKEHWPSRICSNFSFMILNRDLPVGYKNFFC